MVKSKSRSLSLPSAVAEVGSIEAWNNKTEEHKALVRVLDAAVSAKTVEQALAEVGGIMDMGHLLWAYAYMRMLYNKDYELYYRTILAAPEMLLPVVYTPTVGEGCQKFGKMPLYERGCYLNITQRGKFVDVLRDYANVHLKARPDGTYECDCIVFSDGGRILGLGDLGAWGMGIPIGKLDLYTVCAGVDPRKTVPVILDAGIHDAAGNTAKIDIRNHPFYTGVKKARVTHTSAAGTMVNSAYYGPDNMIKEFMDAAVEVFGKTCLLQFEDFNSNDAFPLLDEMRDKYLTYNDDIQGTAAVTVAGILGAIKLKKPTKSNLVELLLSETFLFHGAGSANVGAAKLLLHAGVAPERIKMTNSRGLLWRSEDGSDGSFRNDEQKMFAVVGKPSWPSADLIEIISNVKPTILVGAVGVSPGCFNQAVIEKMVEVNPGSTDKGSIRPTVFALSNPKTQAEVTSENAIKWSEGKVIYGCGTAFPGATFNGRTHMPGQVNNVYCFPGISFGAISCKAQKLPDAIFLAAAEAVANTLSASDIEEDRVVPHPARIREVGLNVAAATVLACNKAGVSTRPIGDTFDAVKEVLAKEMWDPRPSA